MSSLRELLDKNIRIIIIYPIYINISKELESKWSLVKDVRINPENYPASYISERGMVGLSDENDEPIVELLINVDGRHVEVMVKIYRSRPTSWDLDKIHSYRNHLIATLHDCPLDIDDDSIYELRENFFD